MRFEFKIGNIEVQGVSLGGISVTTDVTLSEMRGMVEMQEECLAKIPEYLENLANGYRKVEELNAEFIKEDEMEQRRKSNRIAQGVMDFLKMQLEDER